MDKRTLGQILVDMGRITEDDVQKALEYQRVNGGYFGESLRACGLVTEDELEFGLAFPFDLPYVFPEADSIDPEAAAVVSPEWALANLALPIMKTDEALTLVVESPLESRALEELRSRTELRIELALASATNIRELIRQVYARAAATEGLRRSPIPTKQLFDWALEVAAQRFGISVRGSRAIGWWDDRGTVRRRPIDGVWLDDLTELLAPGPRGRVEGVRRTEWEAELSRAGTVTHLNVRYLADESGVELLFKPRPVDAEVYDRFRLPPAGIVSEVQLLARSGTARFVVTTSPPGLGPELLPHLPTLLLDRDWRSVYLHVKEHGVADDAFSIALSAEPVGRSEELEALRSFHFDVVTADLTGGDHNWAEPILDVASVAFVLWDVRDDTTHAYHAGVRWRLHVTSGGDDQLEWTLEPLHEIP